MVMSMVLLQDGIAWNAIIKIQSLSNTSHSSLKGICVLYVIRIKKRSGRPKSIGMGLLQQGNAVYAITPMPQTIFHGSRNRHGICALHATKTGPQAGMLLQDLFLVLLIPQKAGPTLFVQERSFHVQAVIIPMPLIQGRFLPTMKSVLIACAGCAIKNR